MSDVPACDGPCEVEFDHVIFEYRPGERALDEVTARIAPGEKVLLAGRSGAGKSTLALHLNGILLPRSGAVKLDGRPVRKDTLAWARRRAGIVFQDPDDQLFTPTVGEDVEFGPLNQGLPAREARRLALEALAHVGLEGFESRPIAELSFGQKRRAALATVLAMQPGLIAFDEPFANLDAGMVRRLAALIRDLPATVVLISQEILPALLCCSRMMILSGGRLAADGPAWELARDRELLARNGLDFHFYREVWERLAR